MLMQASTTGWEIAVGCAQRGGAENVASALHLHDTPYCYDSQRPAETDNAQGWTIPKVGQPLLFCDINAVSNGCAGLSLLKSQA